MNLQKGQKTDVTKGRPRSEYRCEIGWRSANDALDIDASAFLLSAAGRCERDEHFIFYGNPLSEDRAVAYVKADNEDKATFTLDFARLSPEVERIAISLTIYEGEQRRHYFSEVPSVTLTIGQAVERQPLATFEFGAGLTQETAIVAGEFYRHQGEWKFNAIGSGFFGGLEALCRSYGLAIADAADEVAVASAAPEKTATPPSTPPASAKASSAQQVAPQTAPPAPVSPPVALGKIDLLKAKVVISLEKNKLAAVKARVAVVFDDSGSMSRLYRNGTVQRAFEKVLAIAAQLDEDGQLDVWFFADKCKRTRSVTTTGYENYVKRERPQGKLGYGNNEPVVMKDVIQKYTAEEPDDRLPVYIIFFSDGGVGNEKKISKLLVDSSGQPLFWQFVGIGRSYYGVLEKLDNLRGRVVDNANFFALDDLDEVSDGELYDRLFKEFPEWLREVKQRGIIRG